MHRIRGLSSNPRIAQGVRKVELNLCYWPRKYARDMRSFLDMGLGYLGRLIIRLQCELFKYVECRFDITPYALYDDSSEAVLRKEAWRRYEAIRRAWLDFAARNLDAAGAHSDSPYVDLVRSWFVSSADQHQEQYDILHDGSFLCSVATAISKTRRPTLKLHHNWGRRRDPPVGNSLENNLEILKEQMLEGYAWSRYESLDFGQEFLPAARLLTDLPIACNRLGKPLQGLTVECFPPGPALNSAFNSQDHVTRWVEFALACRELRECSFEPQNVGRSYEEIHGAEGPPLEIDSIIAGFVGAMCSGPAVEHLRLSMHAFGRDTSEGVVHFPSHFLSKLQSRRVSRIDLSNMGLTASDLKHLIGQLPRFILKEVRFSWIDSKTDSFAEILELLRALKQDSPRCKLVIGIIGAGRNRIHTRITCHTSGWSYLQNGASFVVDEISDRQIVAKWNTDEGYRLLKWLEIMEEMRAEFGI